MLDYSTAPDRAKYIFDLADALFQMSKRASATTSVRLLIIERQPYNWSLDPHVISHVEELPTGWQRILKEELRTSDSVTYKYLYDREKSLHLGALTLRELKEIGESWAKHIGLAKLTSEQLALFESCMAPSSSETLGESESFYFGERSRRPLFAILAVEYVRGSESRHVDPANIGFDDLLAFSLDHDAAVLFGSKNQHGQEIPRKDIIQEKTTQQERLAAFYANIMGRIDVNLLEISIQKICATQLPHDLTNLQRLLGYNVRTALSDQEDLIEARVPDLLAEYQTVRFLAVDDVHFGTDITSQEIAQQYASCMGLIWLVAPYRALSFLNRIVGELHNQNCVAFLLNVLPVDDESLRMWCTLVVNHAHKYPLAVADHFYQVFNEIRKSSRKVWTLEMQARLAYNIITTLSASEYVNYAQLYLSDLSDVIGEYDNSELAKLRIEATANIILGMAKAGDNSDAMVLFKELEENIAGLRDHPFAQRAYQMSLSAIAASSMQINRNTAIAAHTYQSIDLNLIENADGYLIDDLTIVGLQLLASEEVRDNEELTRSIWKYFFPIAKRSGNIERVEATARRAVNIIQAHALQSADIEWVESIYNALEELYQSHETQKLQHSLVMGAGGIVGCYVSNARLDLAERVFDETHQQVRRTDEKMLYEPFLYCWFNYGHGLIAQGAYYEAVDVFHSIRWMLDDSRSSVFAELEAWFAAVLASKLENSEYVDLMIDVIQAGLSASENDINRRATQHWQSVCISALAVFRRTQNKELYDQATALEDQLRQQEQ